MDQREQSRRIPNTNLGLSHAYTCAYTSTHMKNAYTHNATYTHTHIGKEKTNTSF